MKKTTLFTTLALVVIVAIALSTATFAWYSASSQTQADQFTVKAQSAQAELEVTDNQWNNKEIINGILPNGASATGITEVLNYDGNTGGTNIINTTAGGSFKVSNKSATTGAKFKITYAVTGTNAKTLQNVVLFVRQKTTETSYSFTYGAQGADAINGTSYDKTQKTSVTAATKEFSIDAADTVEIEYVLYRNGHATTQADAADIGELTLLVEIVS